MTFAVIILLLSPVAVIYLAYENSKLKRRFTAFEKNSFPKSEAVDIFRDYETLKKENLYLKRKIDRDEERKEFEKNMVTIQVNKSIVPTEKRKFKPSDLSKKELENCMNYYIDNHVKRKRP